MTTLCISYTIAERFPARSRPSRPRPRAPLRTGGDSAAAKRRPRPPSRHSRGAFDALPGARGRLSLMKSWSSGAGPKWPRAVDAGAEQERRPRAVGRGTDGQLQAPTAAKESSAIRAVAVEHHGRGVAAVVGSERRCVVYFFRARWTCGAAAAEPTAVLEGVDEQGLCVLFAKH